MLFIKNIINNNMRSIALTIILLFSINFVFSQVKGTGLCYFDGPPTSFTPDTLYDCEVAIDFTNSDLYLWDRDQSSWTKITETIFTGGDFTNSSVLGLGKNNLTFEFDTASQVNNINFVNNITDELSLGNLGFIELNFEISDTSGRPVKDAQLLFYSDGDNATMTIGGDDLEAFGLFADNEISMISNFINFNANDSFIISDIHLPVTTPDDEGLSSGNYFYTVNENGDLAETGGWISDDSLASSIVNILNLQTIFEGGDMTTSSTVNIGANELIFRKDSADFTVPYNTITLLNSPNDSITNINRVATKINFEVSDSTSRPVERGSILFLWDGTETQMVIDADDQLNINSNLFSRISSDGNVELVGGDTISIGIDISNFGGTANSDFIYINPSVQLAFDAPSYKFFDLPDTDVDLRQAITVNPATGVMALTPLHGDSLFLTINTDPTTFINLVDGVNDTINFQIDPLDSLYLKVGLNDPIFIDRYNSISDTLSLTGLSGGSDVIERNIFASNSVVTSSISIPSNTSYKFKVEVIATVTTAGAGGEAVGESAVYDYTTLIKNVAGTTSIVGSVKDMLAGGPIEDTNMDGSVTLAANDTTDELDISYTPPANADASTVIELKAIITGILIDW